MSTPVASAFITISLLALGGCAPPLSVHQIASQQTKASVKERDAPDHALTDAQVSALSKWMTGHADWSGMSVDIPDSPLIEVDMQGSEGVSSTLKVYERRNGTVTAYLYQGQRLAPLVRKLSEPELAELKSLINGH